MSYINEVIKKGIKMINIIKAKNLNELRREINKTKGLVVVGSGDEGINRAAIENRNIYISVVYTMNI